MDVAWLTVAGPIMMTHAYGLIANPATKETMEFFDQYSDLIRWCSIILRYANDLGTSSV